jgi:hypothetical protein
MTLMIACTDAHLNRNTVPSVPKATYLNQMIRINHQQKNAFSFPLKSLNQQKKMQHKYLPKTTNTNPPQIRKNTKKWRQDFPMDFPPGLDPRRCRSWMA